MISLRTIRNLCGSIRHPVFTGGIARNYYLTGEKDSILKNSDIDIAVDSMGDISPEIAEGFLISHYHPERPRGKLVMQLADKAAFTRVELFSRREAGLEFRSVRIDDFEMRVASLSDVFLNTLICLLPLLEYGDVNEKFIRYFSELLNSFNRNDLLKNADKYEFLWKGMSADRITERIIEISGERKDLLIASSYEGDTRKKCPHCMGAEDFPLAEKEILLAHWGFI